MDLVNGLSRLMNSHIEESEDVDVPGLENLLDLGLRVRSAGLATLELHTFVGESNLLLCKVEWLGDFGDIWKDEEASQCNGQGNDAIDNEEPTIFD